MNNNFNPGAIHNDSPGKKKNRKNRNGNKKKKGGGQNMNFGANNRFAFQNQQQINNKWNQMYG
jgi:hypothetical protein